MVIKMDFKTLPGNESVYLPESGIVIIKRFNLFGRNRKLKEPFRLFYKVFISTWINYLYPIGDVTKNRRCKKCLHLPGVHQYVQEKMVMLFHYPDAAVEGRGSPARTSS